MGLSMRTFVASARRDGDERIPNYEADGDGRR